MRIACVKCSTVYELDDRLIPPSGASVQCTRCGSVFTAKSPAVKRQPPEPKPPGTAPLRSGTQLFAGLGAAAADSAPPRAATQIFGSPFAEPPKNPRIDAGKPAVSSVKAASAQSPGASPAGPSVRSPASLLRQLTVQPQSNSGTLLFESLPPPSADRPLAGPCEPSTGTLRAESLSPAPSHGTQIFGRPFALEDVQSSGGTPAAPGADAPSTVKLPPEEPSWIATRPHRSATADLPRAEPLFESAAGEAPEMSIEGQTSNARRLFIAAAVIGLVALPSLFVARAVLKRRSFVPAEVTSGEESAMALLRRDDRSSRKKAIADLDSLIQKYPSAIGPAATRLLALCLDLDDVRTGVNGLRHHSDELNREISLSTGQRTPEHDVQLAAAQAQLAANAKEMQPLAEEMKALDDKVAAAYNALGTLIASRRGVPEDLGAVRAQAVYYGVKGVDQAEQLIRRYRELGGNDGWDAVASGEYAANAWVSPAMLAQARASNERTRSTDSTFLRAYVLAARLALLQKDYEAAWSLLDAAAALNPSHELARQLIRSVEQAKRIEAGRSAQALGDPSAKRQ